MLVILPYACRLIHADLCAVFELSRYGGKQNAMRLSLFSSILL